MIGEDYVEWVVFDGFDECVVGLQVFGFEIEVGMLQLGIDQFCIKCVVFQYEDVQVFVVV